MIKAIETVYKGYRFRSRLEARWAVFFDALGVEWEYEKEGYDLGEHGRYLPDFWLSSEECFVEIKGNRTVSHDDIAKMLALAKHHPVHLFAGPIDIPQRRHPQAFVAPITTDGLDLGDMPKGSWSLMFARYQVTGEPDPDNPPPPIEPRLWCWHERTHNHSILLWPVPANEIEENGWDTIKDLCARVERLPEYAALVQREGENKAKRQLWGLFLSSVTYDPLERGTKSINSPRLLDAYAAARSARFEHGERPKF